MSATQPRGGRFRASAAPVRTEICASLCFCYGTLINARLCAILRYSISTMLQRMFMEIFADLTYPREGTETTGIDTVVERNVT